MKLRSYVKYGQQSLVALIRFCQIMEKCFPMKSTEISENFDTAPATTAAESPWSNDTCERHNSVLTEAVTKTMIDTKCDLETALAWTLSAKYSLWSFYGFIPYQLVFGRNPNLPSVLVDDPPAIEGMSCSQMKADNSSG